MVNLFWTIVALVLLTMLLGIDAALFVSGIPGAARSSHGLIQLLAVIAGATATLPVVYLLARGIFSANTRTKTDAIAGAVIIPVLTFLVFISPYYFGVRLDEFGLSDWLTALIGYAWVVFCVVLQFMALRFLDGWSKRSLDVA
ncbi:MAG TPA: hypothetical protein VN448_08770 [Gammaproteobacteria bacterium]|jgi:hypothetical protein|nr:hypothetical protein [Gammaproteobacteria bacterium]